MIDEALCYAGRFAIFQPFFVKNDGHFVGLLGPVAQRRFADEGVRDPRIVQLLGEVNGMRRSQLTEIRDKNPVFVQVG